MPPTNEKPVSIMLKETDNTDATNVFGASNAVQLAAETMFYANHGDGFRWANPISREQFETFKAEGIPVVPYTTMP
jgi:hypothetical protein